LSVLEYPNIFWQIFLLTELTEYGGEVGYPIFFRKIFGG